MNKAMACRMLGLDVDHVKASKGCFTYFKSFFYGMFSNAEEKMRNKILDAAREAGIDVFIVDAGCHYHDFVGGAKPGSAKDSFHYVTFKVEE